VKLYNSVLLLFHLPIEHLSITPSGIAIASTITTPIAKPIPSPIRHGFEQNVERPL